MRVTLSQLISDLTRLEGLQNLLQRTALRVTLLQLLTGVTLLVSGAALAVSARAQEVTAASLDEAMRHEVLQELTVNVEALYQRSKISVQREAALVAADAESEAARARIAQNASPLSVLRSN